jgi:hypothetical protein
VASDAGIFTFNTPNQGSRWHQYLAAPIVGIASTPTGNGYWFVAGDGGIFVYGGAGLVHERRVADLDPWLAECRASPVPALRNFAANLEQEGDATRAAVTLPWSTGPVEGRINKLKLIKRSSYGRATLELLQQRVLHAASARSREHECA